MKTTKTITLCLATALALPALAQDDEKKPDAPARPTPPKGAEAILKSLDRNNDGKLQQNEIDMAVVVLRRMDRNENGEIEPDEMVALPQRPGGDGFRRGGSAGDGRRSNFRLPDFSTFDTDNDGKISKEEAPERMKQRFDQIDGDGDGFIDKAEQDQMIEAIRRRFQQAGGDRRRQNDRRPDPNAGQGGADKPKRPALENE